MNQTNLTTRAINTIRFLSADAVQEANSGHPGTPMALAPLAYVLWTRHLRYDPTEPDWPDRDRFILSAGHASMLLYAMLYLTGYDLSLRDMKDFRQLNSSTPGHPEKHLTPGVEVTTGPLGQGFTNGVGMAIAAEYLASIFNQDELPIMDHWIYAICSDGDLMEGISSEAASLAGHLRLGRLIYFYDDNRITIDGETDLTFSEDTAKRFESYQWHVQKVADIKDLGALDQAIERAKSDGRPSLIMVRSHIGYGMPTRQDTAAAHGKPPGEKELSGAKQNLGWPESPRFHVPEGVRDHFLEAADQRRKAHAEWKECFSRLERAHPSLASQFKSMFAGKIPEGIKESLPEYETDPVGQATRDASGRMIRMLVKKLPHLMGGSADLSGSTRTLIEDQRPFNAVHRSSPFIHFGVREHAMAGIMNGIAAHGGLIPFGGTYLVFSDYLRPSARLAALMGLGVIYIFTHDSICLGEDGPTHQPVEHLASLRAIPGFTVIRPADANEVPYAWMEALEEREKPTAIVLARQPLPILDRDRFATAEGLRKGAYVLADLGDAEPDIILMASGSEVGLMVKAGKELARQGHAVRLVSFPSWELFESQPKSYRSHVLPPQITARVAIEAGVPQGWKQWVGDQGRVLGIDHFGESAPYPEVYRHLGFSTERVVQIATEILTGQRE
jgi:transketolase